MKSSNDDEKIQRRKDFQQGYEEHLLNDLFSGKQLVICGDLNTTRNDKDLFCWRKTHFPEGFPSTTKMEREFLEKVIAKHQLTDAAEYMKDLRHTFKGSHPLYPGLRMRLDYFLVPNDWVNGSSSKKQIVTLESFNVLSQYGGSDHVPIRLETRNTNLTFKYSEIKPLQRIEHREETNASELHTRIRCWSLTRKKFICYNGLNCKYSHVCVCENNVCSGNCLEMKHYQSAPKTRRFREYHLKTLPNCCNTVREIDHISSGDIEIAKAIHELPMLLEKTSLIGDLNKSLFNDINLIIEELNRSVEVLSLKNLTSCKNSNNVKIKDVTDEEEANYQDRETEGALEEDRSDIPVIRGKADLNKVNPEDLDRIFKNFDPDKFEISLEMINVLLKIDSKPQSELKKAQGYLEQIQNRVDSVNYPMYEEDKLTHHQLENEAWRSVQTLYFLHTVYADITRAFVQSTRYCGEWVNLTEEDRKQMEVYFYPVRNSMKSIKQLQLETENATRVLTSIFKLLQSFRCANLY